MHEPQDLVEYLRTQFEAAFMKEQQMDMHQKPFNNGSFYRQVFVPGAFVHELTRNSIRVVLKPPFSTLVLSQNDIFAEVFSVHLRSEDGHEVAGDSGAPIDQFLVRRYEHGKYSPFELVTSDGVYDADLNDFDLISGFGTVPELENDYDKDIEAQIADAMRPLVRADELYEVLSSYNIVATND